MTEAESVAIFNDALSQIKGINLADDETRQMLDAVRSWLCSNFPLVIGTIPNWPGAREGRFERHDTRSDVRDLLAIADRADDPRIEKLKRVRKNSEKPEVKVNG